MTKCGKQSKTVSQPEKALLPIWDIHALLCYLTGYNEGLGICDVHDDTVGCVRTNDAYRTVYCDRWVCGMNDMSRFTRFLFHGITSVAGEHDHRYIDLFSLSTSKNRQPSPKA